LSRVEMTSRRESSMPSCSCSNSSNWTGPRPEISAPERTASIRNHTTSWWRNCSKITTSSSVTSTVVPSDLLTATTAGGVCDVCERLRDCTDGGMAGGGVTLKAIAPSPLSRLAFGSGEMKGNTCSGRCDEGAEVPAYLSGVFSEACGVEGTGETGISAGKLAGSALWTAAGVEGGAITESVGGLKGLVVLDPDTGTLGPRVGECPSAWDGDLFTAILGVGETGAARSPLLALSPFERPRVDRRVVAGRASLGGVIVVPFAVEDLISPRTSCNCCCMSIVREASCSQLGSG
jgi:hypothetical protein